MSTTLKNLRKAVDLLTPSDGKHQTSIPGVYCIKFSKPGKRNKGNWRACLGIIVQGTKEIVVGRQRFRFDDIHYIATPIDLPVISRIASATEDKPFLSVVIELDMQLLSEVSTLIEKIHVKSDQTSQRSVFTGKVNEKLLEAVSRLIQLLQSPEDSRALAPLVIKEVLYHFLKGEDGPAIQQFVRLGSKMHKISEAIHSMRSQLSNDVDVEVLAKKANMSRSAFFKSFKEITAVSPIQYQKRLRLVEARRLMIDQGETAEGSAYKVGYKSASQFSREYSRMFGNSPLKDAMKIKQSGERGYQI